MRTEHLRDRGGHGPPERVRSAGGRRAQCEKGRCPGAGLPAGLTLETWQAGETKGRRVRERGEREEGAATAEGDPGRETEGVKPSGEIHVEGGWRPASDARQPCRPLGALRQGAEE